MGKDGAQPLRNYPAYGNQSPPYGRVSPPQSKETRRQEGSPPYPRPSEWGTGGAVRYTSDSKPWDPLCQSPILPTSAQHPLLGKARLSSHPHSSRLPQILSPPKSRSLHHLQETTHTHPKPCPLWLGPALSPPPLSRFLQTLIPSHTPPHTLLQYPPAPKDREVQRRETDRHRQTVRERLTEGGGNGGFKADRQA